MIAAKLKQRGCDDWGDGSFKAPRVKSDGTRKPHKGIDYACLPGQEILSPCVGEVTKLGYPYPFKEGFNYRYVEVTDLQGLRHRVFYIEPTVEVGHQVTILNVIGASQDIAGKFSNPDKDPMTNHVHYEILDDEGSPLDPAIFHS